jgi:hypothetical protein
MARILKANPIPPEGNTVPVAMMAELGDMAGREKRMLPALMEDEAR